MNHYTDFAALKKQLALVKEAKMSYIFPCYGICALCGGVIPVLSAFYAKLIIDVIQMNGSSHQLIETVVILTSLSVVCFAADTLIGGFAQSKYIVLRQQEFNRCARMYCEVDYHHIEDPKFRDRIEVGFRALQGDGRGFQHVYEMIGKLSKKIVTILCFLILIGTFNLFIGILCIASTCVISWINKAYSDYSHSREEDEAKAFRQSYYFNKTCSDFAYGKDIRVFDLKDHLLSLFKAKADQYVQVIREIQDKKFKIGCWELLVLLLQDGISYSLIIRGYFDGTLNLALVSLYLTALISFTAVMREFSVDFSTLITDLKLSCTYFDMISDRSFYGENKGTAAALDKEEKAKIEFKHVYFRYPNTEKMILKDFNFTIHAKEKLAIVGTNGAGKTTIVKLLCGLFEPTSGQILINGKDIREFDKTQYGKMFSTVFQDFDVYACSMLENVIGNDSSQEAKEAGKQILYRVGLKEKIEELPDQADTSLVKSVDPQGTDLSGGQKQKVAIARALAKNGNIVILDEPTSALDALAEAEIYQSFDDLVKDKTAIYISHRLSSTKFCDRIAYFDENGLQEVGTHDELMALKKGYYHMFEVQGQYYQKGVNF